MLRDVLMAMALPAVLLLGWVFVQHAWRRQFSTTDSDGDVLAGRSDCGNCRCARPCRRIDNAPPTEGVN